VHMVWQDAWRATAPFGPRYRRARVLADGSVHFETEVITLAPAPADWNAFPTLAASGNTVHFTWQGANTIWYRSLKQDGDTWRWSDVIDTKAASAGRDTGPSIVADKEAVHILALSGNYLTSRDGGAHWTVEKVPFGSGMLKTVSLALDQDGRPVAAASVIVTDRGEMSDAHGQGGYWTIRLARRTASGIWEPVPGPIDLRPEWAAPPGLDEDVLSDWVCVQVDRTGAWHLAWHGTAATRIYAHDHAYYAWRGPDGVWRPPVPLREPDPAHAAGWSYAPALTLDGDRVVTLVFQDMILASHSAGMDAELGLFRDGTSRAAPLPVARFAHDALMHGEPDAALSAIFPAPARELTRSDDGRVSIDILMALQPLAARAPVPIVFRRLDLTDWLRAASQ